MKKVALSAEILEECLRRIDQGEALESVLAEHVDMVDELRPLLEAARVISKPINVPQAARARSQARFLAAARQTRQAEARQARSRLAHELRQPVLLWSWLPVRVVAALSLVLGLLTSGFYGVNHVAAQSNPGDRFYPVKRAVEQVQLQLAPNVATRLQLETEFDQRRAVEVENLIKYLRPEAVEFTGFATQAVSGKWEINGIPVDLTPGQEQILAGTKVLVQVQGKVQTDGSVLVENAEPHNINFQGKVEALNPAAWQVDGVKFGVTQKTRINGDPQVGSSVIVVALEDDNDSLEAVSVDAQGEAGDSLQKTPTQPAQNMVSPHETETQGDD